jgi:hypothetical protein
VEIFRLEIFHEDYSSRGWRALSSSAKVNAAQMMQFKSSGDDFNLAIGSSGESPRMHDEP